MPVNDGVADGDDAQENLKDDAAHRGPAEELLLLARNRENCLPVRHGLASYLFVVTLAILDAQNGTQFPVETDFPGVSAPGT
jgi:hypothetical protein